MTRSMNFDVTANDSASRDFLVIAQSVERLENKLKALDRLRVEPSVQLNITPATRSAQQLQSRLDALRNVRTTVEVAGAAEARREVTGLVVEIRKLRNARVRIDVDGGARAEVTALAAQLRALRSAQVRVDIEGNAATSVAALANQLRTLRNARVRIDLDGNAATRVAALSTALRTMARDVKVKVGLDDGTFARDIARLHQRVSALRGTTVRIDFDIRPPGIRDDLNDIAAALVRLRGSTSHRVDVNADGARRSLNETILSFKLLAIAASLPIAIPGVFAATSSLLSLGGSAVAAVGALGLLPAAGLAGGAALGTLALGLAHVGDALGPAGTAAEIEKVNAALAKMAPNARDSVGSIRGLGPAFSDMRLEVQQRLFAGVSDQIQGLGDTYLPVLKTGLGGVATELNRGATMWANWARSGPAVADLTTILGNTEQTLRMLAPAGQSVAAALTDIGVVGSEIMPELAGGATAAAERFRVFVAEARRTGELEQWIRGGLDVLGQLGTLAGNTGGILGGMFTAAEAAGADFLGSAIRITGQLDALVNSARGQNELTTVFRESQAAVDALMPGVQDLTSALLGMLGGFASTEGLQRFTGLLSDVFSLVSPLVERLGVLAGETFGNLASGAGLAVAALSPIAGLAGAIVDGLGPIAPLAAAAVIAFKTFGLATAAVVGLGVAITGTAALTSTLVAGLTGSLAAGAAASGAMTGLGAAVGAVGRALPIVGVAAVGLGFALQGMSASTNDAVTALNAGGAAADNMRAALEAQSGVQQAGRSGFDDWANSINSWVNSNVLGIASVESATEAQRLQREGMTALQRAQQDVTTAQGEYQKALDDFGARSPQAVAAAAELASATDRVEQEQRGAADATKSHTDRMVEQADQALAAVNASMGYEGALLNLERAQLRAADAVRDHGAGSLEAREAEFALEQQHFATATAAGDKARADAEAAGASNGAEVAARAHKDELIRLAGQASGPTRDALLDAANSMDIQGVAAGGAEARARAQKDELIRLAGTASGQAAGALRGLAGNFDTLGGAAASAETRARLQKEELLRLAGTMSGPLRTELTNMANQIRTLPSGDFVVRARGELGPITDAGQRVGGQGTITRSATGGVLPGYTPGRDVHDFVSPTAGRLLLSGGEAVMRPEWTRAVGRGFVDGANAAARSGGVAGVADYLRRTAPPAHRGRGEFASGGVVDRPTAPRAPTQRLAFGGLVRTGPSFPEVGNRQFLDTRQAMARILHARMQAEIRRQEAARAAAAAAAGGPLGTGSGAGWQWQMNVLRQRFPGLQLISGFRPGAITATGNPSYHGRGRAVDIPPRMDVFNWIRGNYGGTAREIIFSPAGGSQIHNGRPHMYTGVTRSMHFDHVHWAQKRGGILPSDLSRTPRRMKLADRGGMFASGTGVVNLSGRAERALTGRQNDAFERLVAAVTRRDPGGSPGGVGPVALDVRRAMDTRRGTSISTAPIAAAVLAANGQLRGELAALRDQFGALTAAVRDARPINVTSTAADPVEVARTAQWRMRMPT